MMVLWQMKQVRHRQTNILLSYICGISQNKMTISNSQKKRPDLWLADMGVGEGELDEGSQKAQTSSYGINKYYKT